MTGWGTCYVLAPENNLALTVTCSMRADSEERHRIGD